MKLHRKLAPVKVARKAAETPVIDTVEVAKPKPAARSKAKKVPTRTAKARTRPVVAEASKEPVSFGFPPPAPRRHKTAITRVSNRTKAKPRTDAVR